MKSVGEVMAIGRTFKEALQKGVRSLEIGRDGLGPLTRDGDGQLKGYAPEASAAELMYVPNRDRIFAVFERLLEAEREVSGSGSAEDRQADYEALQECSEIYDPWFVAQMQEIARFQVSIESAGQLDEWTLRQAKRMGFSDGQLARILNEGGMGEEDSEARENDALNSQWPEADIRGLRERRGVVPTYHQVATCAAEVAASTP